MKVFRVEGPLLPPGRRSLALGSFDGLHKGHLSVLSLAKEAARARKIPCAAMIFDPRPDPKKPEITSLAQQMRLFKSLGIDELFIAPFCRRLKAMPYRQFLTLLSSSGVEDLSIGPFTCLGAGGEGTVEKMGEFCRSLPLRLRVSPAVEELGGRVSSTRIRAMLEEGRVLEASALLSRLHSVSGLIVRGLKNGRKMGFPTANLGGKIEGLIPAEGVYCGYLECGQALWRAAISVGTNPTVNPASRRVMVEAHLLDGFSSSLYGCSANVKFLDFLRPQRSFSSFGALREAIALDCRESEERVPRI